MENVSDRANYVNEIHLRKQYCKHTRLQKEMIEANDACIKGQNATYLTLIYNTVC